MRKLLRPWRRTIASGVAPIVGLVALVAVAPREGTEPPATVEIRIHHSKFVPARVEVAASSTVTFVIRNDDPIAHEFILGDEQVQSRHELGADPHHGEVPGEVSVPAGQTARTSYQFSSGGSQLLARKSLPMAWAATPPEPPFETPGSLIFGCHLPGHYTYGMKGTVTTQ